MTLDEVLDAGWVVRLYRSNTGLYVAWATNPRNERAGQVDADADTPTDAIDLLCSEIRPRAKRLVQAGGE